MRQDPQAAIPLFSYPRFWAAKLLPAPFFPVSREEMDELSWDSCDIVIVTGDAYVDHPSFGMALIGRVLEAQGFRVGIIAQPDWRSKKAFMQLGRPNLFFGVTSGNMDSMVNRYTADRKVRSDDAYTPGGLPNHRPDRAVIVYSQRCREAFPDVPVIIGGIEASLRRLAHYDYWSETIRRPVLADAKADMLVYGNGERAVVAIAHHLAANQRLDDLIPLKGTAVLSDRSCLPPEAIHLPSFEDIRGDPIHLQHMTEQVRIQMNPWTGRSTVQAFERRYVVVHPPPMPLDTDEMDRIYELPYQRRPHPLYEGRKIPAFEMIQHSVTILRGCFGGCSFCSITEHEGRFIQNRSESSVIREIEYIRDHTGGFTGFISDIGGPTANMYRMGCRKDPPGAGCRRLSCIHPSICPHLQASHEPLIQLYRRARGVPGIKKILIASGIRHDLALLSQTYIRELARFHVGGYLKTAPEHADPEVLSLMLKPPIETFERFNALFERFSTEAGLEQYLIPYFIAGFPGAGDQAMIRIALWLKNNRFRPDQVQSFIPLPMTLASAYFASGRKMEGKHRTIVALTVPKGLTDRRLQKALLRCHDPRNWPLIRDFLRKSGRQDLIGPGPGHLVPYIRFPRYRKKKN